MNDINTYQILTITHKSTNLKRIGEYVVRLKDGEEQEKKLEEIKSKFGFEEFLYLSTCNRVLFLFTGTVEVNKKFLEDFFYEINSEIAKDSHQEVAHYQGIEALNHLYEVAASVDSLVVGEREILRQLREAYNQCNEWGLTGDRIRLLMRFAVQTAKSVYANTRIGEKPISIVSLAVKRLLNIHASRNSKILLVGAGQTNTLVAKFLAKNQFNNVTVFNRTVAKAERLGTQFGWEFYPISALETYDKGFDIIIVCTGATEPIIQRPLYQKLLQGDTSRKIIIDLAVPNNTSEEVVSSFNINYIEIEDLRSLARKNLSFREREVSNARKIVKQAIDEFQDHFKERQLEIAMRAIPVKIKEIKSHALNTVFRKEVEGLDEDTKALMEKMLTYMEKKCISIPMTVAKDVILKKEMV